MIDLYISPNIFKEHYNKDSKLGELIRCRSVRIYLDLDKSEFEYWLNSFDLENPVMQSLDSDDIRPGQYMISQIKQGTNSLFIGIPFSNLCLHCLITFRPFFIYNPSPR